MWSLSVSPLKDLIKKHLRRKLVTVLSGSIYIFSDDKGKLFIYSDSLSISELAIYTYSPKMELQCARIVNTVDEVEKVAMQLNPIFLRNSKTYLWLS